MLKQTKTCDSELFRTRISCRILNATRSGQECSCFNRRNKRTTKTYSPGFGMASDSGNHCWALTQPYRGEELAAHACENPRPARALSLCEQEFAPLATLLKSSYPPQVCAGSPWPVISATLPWVRLNPYDQQSSDPPSQGLGDDMNQRKICRSSVQDSVCSSRSPSCGAADGQAAARSARARSR